MTQQTYPPDTPEASRVPRGPFIALKTAVAWTGRTEGALLRAVESGEIVAFRINAGRTLRLSERDVGERFGMPLPGPREAEIEAARLAKQLAKTPVKKARETVDHWLYWFYDSTGLLLYIGITNSGVKRMEAHGAQKEWWPNVATIKVDHFATREEAETAETEAIRSHLPIHNVRDSTRFRKGRLC